MLTINQRELNVKPSFTRTKAEPHELEEDIKRLVFREPCYETVPMTRSFVQPFKLKVTQIEKIENQVIRTSVVPEGKQLMIPGISQAFIVPSQVTSFNECGNQKFKSKNYLPRN